MLYRDHSIKREGGRYIASPVSQTIAKTPIVCEKPSDLLKAIDTRANKQ
jgi:hypothetical protein